MTDLSTDFDSYRISQSSASLRLGIIEWDLQAVRFHELHTTVDVFIPSVDRCSKHICCEPCHFQNSSHPKARDHGRKSTSRALSSTILYPQCRNMDCVFPYFPNYLGNTIMFGYCRAYRSVRTCSAHRLQRSIHPEVV